MSESSDWEFPEAVRPSAKRLDYDLDRALSSVLELRAEVPDDAFTASILGTERAGNAVVIDDSGLVLTIGYLIAEASSIWLVSNEGTAVGGHVVAYDYDTGFGLVQALGRLPVPPLPFGKTLGARVGDDVVVAGAGGPRHALQTKVVSRREFAGYWEYVLDEAIFTAPAHPNWGGTALISRTGELQGIGSLFVQNARGGETRVDGNMIVPIDLLGSVLDDLKSGAFASRPVRPWLGFYVAEAEERLVVVGLAEGGPADRADVRVADVVIEVGGAPVGDLADLFRSIWTYGSAGSDINLTLWRDGKPVRVAVGSGDRNDFLKSPRLH